MQRIKYREFLFYFFYLNYRLVKKTVISSIFIGTFFYLCVKLFIVNLFNRSLLERFKWKNKGNVKLIKSIDTLVDDILKSNWNSQIELKETRPDADCIHSDGFYFLNLNIHRTLVLIEFDVNKRVRIIWIGTHDEYVNIFKNNRNTIKKWLKYNGWI